jgi:hypothetical protein
MKPRAEFLVTSALARSMATPATFLLCGVIGWTFFAFDLFCIVNLVVLDECCHVGECMTRDESSGTSTCFFERSADLVFVPRWRHLTPPPPSSHGLNSSSTERSPSDGRRSHGHLVL